MKPIKTFNYNGNREFIALMKLINKEYMHDDYRVVIRPQAHEVSIYTELEMQANEE